MKEQAGFASKGKGRKPLHGCSEVGEASFHIFSVESIVGELSKQKPSNLVERLEMFDVLD